MNAIHPLDAGLMEIGIATSGLQFPPKGWAIIQEWGLGYALRHVGGLRALIDCSLKDDGMWWVHLSVSRATRTPTHEDMATAKWDFFGDRYAYSVWPSSENYVNIHAHCLHIWCRIDAVDGKVLPEFSDVLEGVGGAI